MRPKNKTSKDEGLQEYLSKKKEEINARLDMLVPERDDLHAVLYQAARYTLCSPGKRLRPILTLATAEMLQEDSDFSLIPACAIEMIHAYSMIHDDLPCMDNDDFRRGKPSLHKAFSEGSAVLAGDFLLTRAFEILAQGPGLNNAQKVSLITTLSKDAGGEGMIGGQVMDLQSEGKNVSVETLRSIHRKKTAALFSAAVEFGAITADAPPKIRQQLRAFGETFGLAFQMIDDVLDLMQPEEKHGKATSSDITNQKATVVSQLGLEKANAEAYYLTKKALEILQALPFETTLLQGLTEAVYSENMHYGVKID